MKWAMAVGFLLLLGWASIHQYWFLAAIFVVLIWACTLAGD